MKHTVVIEAPVFSRSGYGHRSADLAQAFIDLGYNVLISATGWGDTPTIERPELDPFLMKEPPKKIDVYVKVGLPTEMRRVGSFNILFTAGIEATAPNPLWIDAMNRTADLVIVSSTWMKKNFTEPIYKNDQGAELKLTTPIEVLFEGISVKDTAVDPMISYDLNAIPEDFAFLFVGHWLPGALGQDRKDVSGLIHTFFAAFAGKKKKPALILKTSIGTDSASSRIEIIERTRMIREMFKKDADLPSLYLIHGDLSECQLSTLYAHPKVKAHVTLTHGEGFGRPILEASMSGAPVIAPAEGGHTDFLKFYVKITGEWKPVDKSAFIPDYMTPVSQWYYASYKAAARDMLDVYERYGSYKTIGQKQLEESRKFSYDNMVKTLSDLLAVKLESVPVTGPVILPFRQNETEVIE